MKSKTYMNRTIKQCWEVLETTESGNIQISHIYAWGHGLFPGFEAWKQILAFIKRKRYTIS